MSIHYILQEKKLHAVDARDAVLKWYARQNNPTSQETAEIPVTIANTDRLLVFAVALCERTWREGPDLDPNQTIEAKYLQILYWLEAEHHITDLLIDDTENCWGK